MNDFPVLTVLWLLPILGAVVLTFMPSRPDSPLAKQVGIGFSVVTLLLGIAIALDYTPEGATSSARTSTGSSCSAPTTPSAWTASAWP